MSTDKGEDEERPPRLSEAIDVHGRVGGEDEVPDVHGQGGGRGAAAAALRSHWMRYLMPTDEGGARTRYLMSTDEGGARMRYLMSTDQGEDEAAARLPEASSTNFSSLPPPVVTELLGARDGDGDEVPGVHGRGGEAGGTLAEVVHPPSAAGSFFSPY